MRAAALRWGAIFVTGQLLKVCARVIIAVVPGGGVDAAGRAVLVYEESEEAQRQ